MPDEIVFDGRDLYDLGRNMQSAALRFREELQPTLMEIGEEVKDRAKVNAEAAGSSSIPPTIGVRPLPGAVGIHAGEPDKPLARLWEMGNIRSGRSFRLTGETFNHPVFARGPRETWRWTTQARHRFLAPALAENRRDTTRRMEAAWERALRVTGLRPVWTESLDDGPSELDAP